MPHKILDSKIAHLSALLWLGSCSVTLAAANTIVPGRSIGQIRLREVAKQATAALGQADSVDAAMGRCWQVWYSRTPRQSKHYELDVLTVRDESGLHEFVEQVRVTSPGFTTSEGIHVGSRLSAVMTAFPQLRRVNPQGAPATNHQGIALYDNVNLGIMFEFATAKDGVPGSAKCHAILVHLKQKGALEEYLPWYMLDNKGMLK